MLKETVGLIGAGNMGTAIVEGVLSKKIISPAQVWVYDKAAGKAGEFSKLRNVHEASSNQELVSKAKILLLAVKPQDLVPTIQELKSGLTASHILISILAGTPIDKIKSTVGAALVAAQTGRRQAPPLPHVVRAMPNLGAKVGVSMTALTASSEETFTVAEAIFLGCGKTLRLEEKYFDLITALSGSGPAYFFYLMELMVQEACQRGLNESQARVIATQTALGAALLAETSGVDPAMLRQQVTSKGGTTEAAFTHLLQGFPKTFHDAIQAAYERGKELSKSE